MFVKRSLISWFLPYNIMYQYISIHMSSLWTFPHRLPTPDYPLELSGGTQVVLSNYTTNLFIYLHMVCMFLAVSLNSSITSTYASGPPVSSLCLCLYLCFANRFHQYHIETVQHVVQIYQSELLTTSLTVLTGEQF